MSKSDANIKMQILWSIGNFDIKKVEIQSEFDSRSVDFYSSPKDINSKKSSVKDLVTVIAELLSKAGGFGGAENFFQTTGSEAETILVLLGANPPLDIVQRVRAVGPYVWLDSNYKSLAMFNNPDVLLKTVRTNLAKIIDAAEKNKNEFVRLNMGR